MGHVRHGVANRRSQRVEPCPILSSLADGTRLRPGRSAQEPGEERSGTDYTHRSADQDGPEQHQQSDRAESQGAKENHPNAKWSQPRDMEVRSVMGEDKGLASGRGGKSAPGGM